MTVKAWDSPIGALYAELENGCLCALRFEAEDTANRCALESRLNGSDADTLKHLRDWLARYFAKETPPLDSIPLSLHGSTFQQRVWEELKRIPAGGTVSYGQIASRLEQQYGKRVSAQAVGGAVGKNPAPILLPCHRVIGADGRLVGYGGGIERKVWLLEHEGFTVKDGRVMER